MGERSGKVSMLDLEWPRSGAAVMCLALVAASLPAQETSPPPAAGGDLRSAVQNPVGDLISLPVETTFDFGAPDGGATFVNLQPVVPIDVGAFNIVTRTIVPIIDAPGSITGLPGNPDPIPGPRKFGLGDINLSLFASPKKAGEVIFGVGPAIGLPTATSDILGSGKWNIGPSFVVLTQPKPWTLGILAGNLWSFAGDSDRQNIKQFIAQPFISYNLAKGWFLTSSPMITANWSASGSQRWLVPVGGGFGRLVSLGSQPMQLMLQGFYNVAKPDGAPNWALRFTIQALFPKK